MDDLVKLARSDAAALFSRDLIRNGSDEASELRQSPEYRAAKTLEQTAARIEALERQVKAADALADALTPFAFFDPDEPDITSDTTQKAWELRYQDRFKDWVDFGEIDAARNALAAYRATKEGGA